MKLGNFLKSIVGLLAIASAALSLGCSFEPAYAATNRAATTYKQGTADATANSTFATTAFADLPGSLVTFTPIVDPNAGILAGNQNLDTIIVEWSADVSKATATTGICGVFANGAQVAKTARTIASAAGEGTMGGVFYLANTTTGAQTVKIQCKSGDTNVFTVLNAEITVTETY